MQSGSRPASSSDQQSSKLGHLFGVLIALLTLTLPAIVITTYSGSPPPAQSVSDRASALR